MDMGANLTNAMFAGVYHGKKEHHPDIAQIMQRATDAGVKSIVVTIGSLKDCRYMDQLRGYQNVKFTMGIHPTQAKEFGPQAVERLRMNLRDPAVVMFGEIGLDYDRLNCAPKDVQLAAFSGQLALAMESKLPLFLHCRNAYDDFFRIIKEFEQKNQFQFRGVVHSFTGSYVELERILKTQFFVSINGCGMKTEEQCQLIKNIPRERLILETDCPYCLIGPSYAGYKYVKSHMYENAPQPYQYQEGMLVKGRNEPCGLKMVAEAVSTLTGIPYDELQELCYNNGNRLLLGK